MNKDGNTALQIAVLYNIPDKITLLTKYECYINHKNRIGETAL